MLFMYIHTHSAENCKIMKPAESSKIFTQVGAGARKAGIKTLGTYVAQHEHTIYSVFEANDIAALEAVLVPMTAWGNARLIPIISMEQPAQAAKR